MNTVSVTVVRDKARPPPPPFFFSLREKGMRHIHLEIAFLLIHPAPVLVHLISDNITPICAEQSERKPFLAAALDGLSFSSGLQS